MNQAMCHLQSARQPLTLAELEALCDVALEPSALASVPQRLVGGVVFYWHTHTVAAKPTPVALTGTSPFAAAAGPGAAARKRTVLGARRRSRSEDHLAELRRKKQMIEAHTAVDAKGAEELAELTEKWAEAGREALETLLKNRSNSGTLAELCKELDILPGLLGIEADDDDGADDGNDD